MQTPIADYTAQLQQLMQQVGISSYTGLSQAAGISEKQLRTLRRGQIDQLRLGIVQKIAQALHLSLADLLATFSPEALFPSPLSPSPLPPSPLPPSPLSPYLADLQQECDRLHIQLAAQKQQLQQEFQQDSLQILESLILQLPTAAYAAQNNLQAPAIKLLPLLRPIDALLQDWGVSAIAPVGAELPYSPQHHQLLEGTANPGDLVKIRYTGYQQGAKLLYRAKVSPVKS
jgi:DNA-binding Xre family transcriptional regulator